MGCAVLSTLFMLPACDADKDLGDEGTSSEGGADDDTSDDSGGETSGDDGEITNGCGTFDTSLPGDSPIPQDPDDPEILTACDALCGELASTCEASGVNCEDACKMQSCDVCPGTLAEFVECQAVQAAPDGCTCDANGVLCDVAEACLDQYYALSQCGG